MKITLVGHTYEAEISKRKYNNNRVALSLYDCEDGCQIAVATVNLPEEELGEDEVFIKNWSENEGILQQLIAHKIISEPIGKVPTGFVMAHKCKLLI